MLYFINSFLLSSWNSFMSVRRTFLKHIALHHHSLLSLRVSVFFFWCLWGNFSKTCVDHNYWQAGIISGFEIVQGFSASAHCIALSTCGDSQVGQQVSLWREVSDCFKTSIQFWHKCFECFTKPCFPNIHPPQSDWEWRVWPHGLLIGCLSVIQKRCAFYRSLGKKQ